MTVDELPAVLTVEQYAAFWRIGRTTAYDLVRSGDLEAVRLGRTIRIPRRVVLEQLGEDLPNEKAAVEGGDESPTAA